MLLFYWRERESNMREKLFSILFAVVSFVVRKRLWCVSGLYHALIIIYYSLDIIIVIVIVNTIKIDDDIVKNMVYSRYSTNERVVVESTLYQLATVYVRDNNKKMETSQTSNMVNLLKRMIVLRRK